MLRAPYKNGLDSVRASASINAHSREHSAPAAVADAVTLTAYLRASVADLPATYSISTFMAVSFILWSDAPPTWKANVVYRLSFMFAARKLAWMFVVISAGVNTRFPLSTLSRTLGKRKLPPSASYHSMDAADCRYSIMDVTAPISSQSSFSMKITACEEQSNDFPNRSRNLSPRHP